MTKVKLKKIILKTWKRFGISAFIFSAIASYCFFTAAVSASEIYSEQQQPYELIISAENLSDDDIMNIEKIENIEMITSVYNLPATASIDGKDFETALFGVNGAYLDYEFISGSSFPEISAMPYVILNRYSVQQYIKADNSDVLSYENFIGKQILLTINDKPYAAMITGIFEDNSEEPISYISLSCANNLLIQNGTVPALYSSAYVKCLNAGYTQDITSEIESLGFFVENPNTELEDKWETTSSQNTYLFLISAVAIIASCVIIYQKKLSDSLVCGDEYDSLVYMGLTAKQLTRINRARTALFLTVSICTGIIVALIAMSFAE